MGLTAKQLKDRRKGIGASEIAALVGLSQWATPVDIYASKVLDDEPREMSLPAEIGLLLEQPISRLYEKRTGFVCRKSGTLFHPDVPIALATPDRIVYAKRPANEDDEPARLLQIKSTSWQFRDQWGEPGTDQIPEAFIAQTTWEMGVTGVPLCDVAVLIDKDDFRIYTVEFRAQLWASLLEAAFEFWKSVEARTPPPPDASDGYRRFIERTFPAPLTNVMIQATPEIEEIALALRALETGTKAVESAIDERCNALRACIGDASGVVGSFGKVTWLKNPDRNVVDTEAVLAEIDNLGQALQKERPDVSIKELGELLLGMKSRHLITKPGPRVLRKKWSEQ